MRLELQRDLLAGQSESFPDARIEYLEWNGSGLKLAVFQPITRQMLLFDGQTLEKREKFSIKSAASSSSNQDDEGSTQGWIKAIAFSPDSKRMAIAHSESMIHVYRIGQQWSVNTRLCAGTKIVIDTSKLF